MLCNYSCTQICSTISNFAWFYQFFCVDIIWHTCASQNQDIFPLHLLAHLPEKLCNYNMMLKICHCNSIPSALPIFVVHMKNIWNIVCFINVWLNLILLVVKKPFNTLMDSGLTAKWNMVYRYTCKKMNSFVFLTTFSGYMESKYTASIYKRNFPFLLQMVWHVQTMSKGKKYYSFCSLT